MPRHIDKQFKKSIRRLLRKSLWNASSEALGKVIEEDGVSAFLTA